MTTPRNDQFLTLKAYRQKRLMDGARIIPVIGAIVLVFPLVRLFVGPDEANSIGATIVYLFVLWMVLIAAAYFVSRRLQDTSKAN